MKVKLSDIQAWAEFDKVEPKKDGEVTAEEYSAMIGRKIDRTRDLLNRYVKDGKWNKRRSVIDGRSAWVYSPKEPPSE